MPPTKNERRPDIAEYLHPADAAALLGLQRSTLDKWREHRSDGPPFVRLMGRAIRYHKESLLAWANAHSQRTHVHGDEVVAR